MHEIIHVVDPAAHARVPRQDLEIEAVEGHPLAEGYYFVLWPTPTRTSRAGRGKRYFGPFAMRSQARLLQTSAMALGLVPAEPVMRTVVECRSTVRRLAVPNDAIHPLRRMPWVREAACAA